jgi:DNA polymerase-3 subunit delta'
VARGKRGAEPAARRSAESGWPAWADAIAAEQLRSSLRNATIGHAYLLAGPNGVGKERLALAFAQAICCTNPSRHDLSDPCGACRSCLNVTRGTHPDVERYDLQTQAQLAEKPSRGTSLSIDTMRRLRASAALLPLEGTRRLLIVDDAETLLEPAQQALLKVLEEPPPHVTILLLADEAEALLETVRSRCQAVVVRPVATSIIEEALDKREVDRELAQEIVMLSRGRPAWAMVAADDRQVLQRSRQARQDAESWISASTYERLVTAFRLGEQFGKRRSDVIGVVQATIQLMREEMLAAANSDRDTREHAAGDVRARIPSWAWSRAIAAALQCLQDLESNVRPRLALEAMVLAWPSVVFQTE